MNAIEQHALELKTFTIGSIIQRYFGALALVLLLYGCQEEHAILLLSQQDTSNTAFDELPSFFNKEDQFSIVSGQRYTLLEDSLLDYGAVILDGITFSQLDHFQLNTLRRFIYAGGTFIGVGLTMEAKDQYIAPEIFHTSIYKKGQAAGLQKVFGNGRISLVENSDSNIQWSKALSPILDDLREPNYDDIPLEELPPDHWFGVDTLSMFLDEPIELEVLPDGNVLFIERAGKVKICSTQDKSVETVAELAVISSQSNGLNGMALDPNYAENHWVYLSYLSTQDTSHQRISRFTFHQNHFNIKSEEVIMQIPIRKINGWHGTNSIEFDGRGNLYISMCDFTLQSKDISGYAQIDERPGHHQMDAQRTSANSNSYLGKILRIHPEEDGSYTIPETNLFSHHTDTTLPEIFAMGCRNPYRFTPDPRQDLLFIGDVGPDAWEDGEKGSRGFDELNIATSGSFYGWPYFVANNIPYRDFDYSDNQLGSFF
ncbi:MAG: hypothetical protein EX254_09600, partial [Flavobacteriaceae bacterium]